MEMLEILRSRMAVLNKSCASRWPANPIPVCVLYEPDDNLVAAVRPIKTQRAFTLIEILLAIAIIAVLAALLLPSLSRGVAKGKRTKCMANLKQIGVAFHSFA